MSGIFGLIRFDGGPVDQGDVLQMQAAMSHWGQDAQRSLITGSAGFGACLTWDTPESVAEAVPIASADGRFVFTAAARIDNRDELLAALDVHGDRRSFADGALVQLAYDRWGPACAARILGDWSFAVWHPDERRLFLARDHYGNTSLYFSRLRTGSGLAFASDRRALHALAGQGPLNELYLAQLLVSWPGYHGPDTIDQRVSRLPPAHTLTATGAAQRLERYWRLEEAPPIRLSSDDDYADGLREALRSAVRARVRSRWPVAGTLSGGLDSGAVVAIAAQEVSDGLVAVTSTAGSPPGGANGVSDLEGARLTARAVGNLELRITDPAGVTPLAGVDRLIDIHGEPGHAAVNYYWLLPMIESVRGYTVLTGQTGNRSFSWTGVPDRSDLTRAVAARQFSTLLPHLARLAAAHQPLSSVIAIGRGIRRGTALHGWRGQSMINPDFARRIGLRDLMRQAGHDPLFRSSADRTQQLRILRPGRDIVGGVWAELGAAAGCAARDPMRDVRLLTFACGLPNHVWRGPMDRWLARQATRGLLPDAIRLAPKRGVQHADLGLRMNLEAREMLDRVATTRRAGDYVNLPLLDSTIRRLSASPPAVWQVHGAAVLRAFGVIRFLEASNASKRYGD